MSEKVPVVSFSDLQAQSGHTYPKAAAKLIQKIQTAKFFSPNFNFQLSLGVKVEGYGFIGLWV